MAPLLYHHSHPLAHVRYGIVKPLRVSRLTRPPRCSPGRLCEFDDWHDQRSMELAYEWLAEQVGFYPLFLAVGTSADDKRITGYQVQFHPESERSPEALFSYKEKPGSPLLFNDYDQWHIIINDALNSLESLGGGRHTRRLPEVSDVVRRLVMKPSWRDSDWLRRVRRQTHSVQAVVPSLDLAAADRVWCADDETRAALVDQGFDARRIKVKHLTPIW